MLIIIRGFPGSGKSTLAKEYVQKGFVHYEADMYFMQNGVYVFDKNKLSQAHAWCLKATSDSLTQGKDVVVSNTFVQRWEYEPYVTFCNDNNIAYGIVVAKGNFTSVHNVPQSSIQRMRFRWED